MEAGSDERANERERRGWLLRCRGMLVESPEGPVGRVLEPVYGFSARWDQPSALEVETPQGTVRVPIETVTSVDVERSRIEVSRRPGAPAPPPDRA